MKYATAVLLIGLAVAWVAVAHSEPAPRPNVVSATWELEFKYQAPKQLTLTLPGWKRPRTFWYMLFTVKNRSGADQSFVPEFDLYTDTGEVLPSVGGPSLVFIEIQKLQNNPLLRRLSSFGKLLQGADNAMDGVAIWNDIPADARGFDVFVGGLSGEEAAVKLPTPVMVEERGDDGKVRQVARDKVTLRKTLKLTYGLPGERASRAANPPKLLKKSWVMR